VRRRTLAIALLLVSGAAAAGGRVPLSGARLVPPAGMTASLDGKRVTFKKASGERRLLAFESHLEGLVAAKALEVRYSLQAKGGTARLAFLAYGASGNAWFRIGSRPLTAGDALEARLALRSWVEAEFGRGDGKAFAWRDIGRVWFGIVIDGPAKGTFDLTDAALTSEPYRPTRPLAVPSADPKLWNLSHDRAATLTLAAEAGAMRADFTFPGGRHMYAVPSVRLQELELSGYAGLRFSYRATLPKGMGGLLVMLVERGGGTQYIAEPAPAASADWTTVTIPFARFKRGSWSEDDNDRLDLDDVRAVAIGAHGTTPERPGKGSIRVRDIVFVP